MPPRRKTPEVTLPAHAIALVRISDDPDGRAVGVGRQEEDCRGLALRLGWTVGEVIVENDTSAYSTRQTLDGDGLPVRVTKRPEFRRALKALHTGKADGLIVYDIDRLARQPRDLEALIDLAEVRGTPVQAVTGSLDVSTSAGRAMARVLMAMANKSSEDTGRRVARAARQRAEQGQAKTDGFRAYGYERDKTIRGDEAAVVREIAERILLGDSVRSIAADLNARGIPSASGGEWRNPAVKSVVRKASVAGLREYQGEVVADGQWTAILDQPTWELVRAVLDGSSGTNTRAGGDRYLLSGIATCGACSARLYVGNNHNGSKSYRCNECHRVTRSMPWVDEYVTEVVVRLLSRADVAQGKARRGSGRPSRITTTLVGLRERRKQILRDFAVNLSADDLAEMLRAVDERIASLEAEAHGPTPITMPRSREFTELPLERQRAVVRALVAVEVLPSGRGRGLDPAGIRVTAAY